MNKFIPILTLSMAILFSSGLIAAGKPLTITEDGKTEYQIVTATNASSSEIYAASLLQKYLAEISGVSIPVIQDNGKENSREILLGFSNRTAEFASQRDLLAPDGFMISTKGKKLFILGGEHNGTLYGVVELLERYLGCRKYSVSVNYVPKIPNIVLNPINIMDQPKATYRVVHGEFCNDPEYKAWQRLDVIEDMFADGYYVHTLGKLIPWEQYFNTHPEYYALMNGKRTKDQPCLSNPEVLNLTISKLREEMALQPAKKYWSVSQNDNYTYCQCPDCKKAIDEEGSPSGPVIRFVNKVAEAFPDKIISTLAYQYSRQAPKQVVPRENVQIMLCTIELNRAISIEKDPSSQQFRNDIIDWGKISKHIYLWDYTVNFANSISPFPNLHVLQPNIQFFVKNGALEHFQQSNTANGHEFSELKSYLISRLLWNPDINADSVINQFLEGYYLAAAPFIRYYIDHLQQEYVRSGQLLDIYGSPVWNANTSLSADNMAVYSYLFDKAESAVAGRLEILRRVRTARLPIQFAAMEIGKNDMYGPRGWYTEMNGKFVLKPRMKVMLESFNNTCKAAKVETLSESGLTPDEYYKATQHFLDRKIENNLAFRKKVTASPIPSIKYSNGDMSVLTNGVQGANDYKVHWLGWEGTDFQLTLDLESVISAKSVKLNTLYDPKSWILHPKGIKCETSTDGNNWLNAGEITVSGDQQKEEVTRTFTFDQNMKSVRYVRFSITGTKSLPIWHPSAGGASWVFVDEVIVE